MERFADLTILVVYCAVIFGISAQPSVLKVMLFAHQDKLIHLAAYTIMGLLTWRSFRHWVRRKPLLAVCTIVFCSLYGLSDELHQSFVPGRSADPYDWVADTAGALVSVVFLLNRKTTHTLNL